MPKFAVQSINFIDKQITVFFEQSWFQEDIPQLQQLVLDNISDHQVLEVIQGADRENIRFRWLAAEFVLNFEIYSQSCWICAQDEASQLKTHALFNLLEKPDVR